MSILDEVPVVFDLYCIECDQDPIKKIGKRNKKNIDVINVAENLFKGTILDFRELACLLGGGMDANNDSSIHRICELS